MYLNKKTIIIIVLCIWIVFMAVGFALFQERLTITGTSHIDSNWEIKIIDISTSDIVGDATEKAAPSYTDTTASLKVSLINPTDSLTYNIKIKNLGTLDARIKNINTYDLDESDAIEYEIKCKVDNGNYEVCDEEHFKNQVLEPNKEQMVKIKITFKQGYVGDPSTANKTMKVKLTIDYVQNFEVNGVQINNYDEYSIGDLVEFAGSNWYVIEDSPDSQDYVVLLKQNVLTNAELGNYASSSTGNSMAYYYSETCHVANSYGYTSRVTTGCAGHAFYDRSSIKLAVESYMTSKGIESSLKEVDAYKIRLLKPEELIDNLGWTSGTGTYATTEGNNVPTWIYGSSVGNYWTMYSNDDNTSNGNYIHRSGIISKANIDNTYAVRPVINLYKSAIE